MPKAYIGLSLSCTARFRTLAGASRRKASESESMTQRAEAVFFHEFYVASSICEMGMLQLELEEIDE